VHLFSFDAEYLRRLRAGDPVVEQHFVGYFSKLLLVKLRARGATMTSISDVTQETFFRVLKTLRSPRGIESPSALGAFVNSVCNNVLQEQHRDVARREPLDDDYDETPAADPDAEEAMLTAETRAAVQKVLSTLPPKDADLLRAVFVDERSKDDVCAEFGVTRDYLRVLLHRAKEQFRRRYLDEKRSAVHTAVRERVK
jgi:RNA polymerase sigma-70 factor (ECF subfamily)